MYLIDPKAHTRRAFLRRSGQLAMAGSALPMALNLALMGDAAAQAAGDDYKALVCVFLYGGNDHANTVVTYDDASYNAYSAIRGGGPGQTAGGIALSKASLAATLLNPTTTLPEGRQYALHPSMSQLATLFNTDAKLAVQLNVGPLVVPLTRAQFTNGNRKLYPLPPSLFSHNDQQSIWQSSSPEGSTIGWGGNMGDLMLGQNTNSLLTCIGVGGNTVFLSGDSALAYGVGVGGPTRTSLSASSVYGSSTVKAALAEMVREPRSHAMEGEYTKITKRAVDAEGTVTAAIGSNFPASAFPSVGLGKQLAMVARLIRGRAAIGAKRQVFFVAMGRYDMHDDLISRHPPLLQLLSDSLAAFYRQMALLGVADKVTAFTASEFGRTLASNGDGSDHGWGGHQFVLGGAVKGKQFYGTSPVVSITSDPRLAGYEGQVGQGRLIPSTSVDQYAATLATWFGVPATSLEEVVPNLRNFGGSANGIDYPKNVGFLA
ncbi:uncharacterized protein (DUF1501 family) [Variovorax sp. 54]|uniref:DUF1501 domain-containing protein n=1 Tax=Variovorax sp. 54 TaxID=2035212 RepID=UPI000C1805A5|nr:DUF1501 domain-containing protein [Variovorax sp. 54]PIF73803.1 uncharacterized protein (DUF1501 family) [Variovorax sp. 54]